MPVLEIKNIKKAPRGKGIDPPPSGGNEDQAPYAVGEILDNDPEDPDEDSFGMQDDMQELER